jgi:hypothetical protein
MKIIENITHIIMLQLNPFFFIITHIIMLQLTPFFIVGRSKK